MANTSPMQQNIDLISSIITGTGKLFGTGGTTETRSDAGASFTETKQTQYSDIAMRSMLDSLLGGTGGIQGLASIASGAKRAGVYNSTTNQLLVNDLLSRTTGKIAEISAPTTTSRAAVPTSSRSTTTPGSILGAKGGTLAGLGILGAVLGSKTVRKKIGDWWDIFSKPMPEGSVSANMSASQASDMADAFFDPSSSAYTTNTPVPMYDLTSDPFATIPDLTGMDMWDMYPTDYIDVFGIENTDFTLPPDPSYGFLDGPLPIGSFLQAASGDVQGGIESGIGATLGSIGGPVGSMVGANVAPEVFEQASDAVQGAGDGLSEFVDVIGGATDGTSIVCYELVRTGEMSPVLAKISSSYAPHLNPAIIRGYHWMCPTLLILMRKYPIIRNLLRWGATTRSLELSGSNWQGKLVRLVFEPICYILGKTVATTTATKIDIPAMLAR